MKVLGVFLALLACTLAEPTFFNLLNPDTGDFSGFSFPALREEIETFIDVDVNGDVVSYGLYIPTLTRAGLDNPSPSDPPLGAAIRFDKSSLPNPDQMPYDFVLLNFNPGGHPPMEWLHPHFDVHLYLETPEFARSIECFNSTFPPCFLSAYQFQLYSTLPNPDFYPAGYGTSPELFVPTMGAHLTGPITNDFEITPANLFGSYNGELIFHEPMIASAILAATETGGPQTFSWPATNKFPMEGRFFTQYTVETVAGSGSVGDRYKISFHTLATAPESNGATPIFMGSPYAADSSVDSYTNTPSSKKDCLINSVDIDGGFKLVTASGEFCCRAQGTLNVNGDCERPTCSGTAPLVNPPNAFIKKVGSNKCYAKCYERV